MMQTEDFGYTRTADALFENPDGTPIILDEDYNGKKRTEHGAFAGPFAGLKKRHNRIRVW